MLRLIRFIVSSPFRIVGTVLLLLVIVIEFLVVNLAHLVHWTFTGEFYNGSLYNENMITLPSIWEGI